MGVQLQIKFIYLFAKIYFKLIAYTEEVQRQTIIDPIEVVETNATLLLMRWSR